MHLPQLLLVRSYFRFHRDIKIHDTGVERFRFVVHPCKDVFELLAQLNKRSSLFIREIKSKVDEARILFSAHVDRFIVER